MKYLLLITLLALSNNAIADHLWVLNGWSIERSSRSGTVTTTLPQHVLPSGIGLDRSDGTLWFSTESTSEVYNIGLDGEVLSSFHASAFDMDANELEGIAVDNNNFTLWVVDDSNYMIYNLERDGSLISSFSTRYAGATGGQDIAVDVRRNTLWIIDNEDKALYEFSKKGELLNKVSLKGLTPKLIKPQGLTFDERNGTIWIVGHTTNYVHHITRKGKQLHAYPLSGYIHAISYDGFNR